MQALLFLFQEDQSFGTVFLFQFELCTCRHQAAEVASSDSPSCRAQINVRSEASPTFAAGQPQVSLQDIIVRGPAFCSLHKKLVTHEHIVRESLKREKEVRDQTKLSPEGPTRTYLARIGR